LIQFGIDHIRHPNGSQAFPDFRVSRIGVELKSTSTQTIFLNDSFFVDDHIYLISTRKTSLLSFGKDLYTDQEKEVYLEYRERLASLKKQCKGVGGLSLYPRSANRYNTAHLDRDELWRKVKMNLS